MTFWHPVSGDPIRYAKAALLSGLHMLGPQDQFTVVAFDHEQLWWTGGSNSACCADHAWPCSTVIDHV